MAPPSYHFGTGLPSSRVEWNWWPLWQCPKSKGQPKLSDLTLVPSQCSSMGLGWYSDPTQINPDFLHPLLRPMCCKMPKDTSTSDTNVKVDHRCVIVTYHLHLYDPRCPNHTSTKGKSMSLELGWPLSKKFSGPSSNWYTNQPSELPFTSYFLLCHLMLYPH